VAHLSFAEVLLLGLYPALLCAAIAADVGWRIIPNLIIAALLVGFGALALSKGVPDLGPRLAAAGLVTAMGFALFAEDLIGAGDAKLAGALVLWVDPGDIPLFMALCAGLAAFLTLAATLAARRMLPAGLGKLARTVEAIPYGAALAAAGLAVHPVSMLIAGA